MAKIKFLFLSIFFLLNIYCFSQDLEFIYPSDTLIFSNSRLETDLVSLDSVKGEIIETFVEPQAYLYKYQLDSTIKYTMAVKSGDKYLIYPMFTANSGNEITNFFSPRSGNKKKFYVQEIKKYKFNNSPDSFLIVGFYDYTLLSNSSGFEIKRKGYMLWNISKMEVLHLVNYQSVENWPYGDGMVATNSGMVRYYGYDVFFENGELVIQIDGKKDHYQFNNGLLIRNK
jgi:hypothetical protein